MYAYNQLNLDPETANHCNFDLIIGDMTGTYRFQTGLYGLTDRPSDIQKAMDYTILGLKSNYCFLDDILIVSKGSVEEHKKCVFDCLHRLDEENLSITFQKAFSSKIVLDWHGYHIAQTVLPH